jgi:hypothetical protein
MRVNSSVEWLSLVRVASMYFRTCNCQFLQHDNNIGADGARAIADAISVNSSVQELYLVRLSPSIALVFISFIVLNVAVLHFRL